MYMRVFTESYLLKQATTKGWTDKTKTHKKSGVGEGTPRNPASRWTRLLLLTLC